MGFFTTKGVQPMGTRTYSNKAQARVENNEDTKVRSWTLKGYLNGKEVDERFRGTAAEARAALDERKGYGWRHCAIDKRSF